MDRSHGTIHDGLGLVGTTARPGRGAAQSITTRPRPGLHLPAMVGWRSHGVEITRDPEVGHLVEIASGDPAAVPELDGVVAPGVIGTRLHGPALALNPELADLVLARAVKVTGWDPLPIPRVETARARRITEVERPPPSTTNRFRIRARLSRGRPAARTPDP